MQCSFGLHCLRKRPPRKWLPSSVIKRGWLENQGLFIVWKNIELNGGFSSMPRLMTPEGKQKAGASPLFGHGVRPTVIGLAGSLPLQGSAFCSAICQNW